MRGVSAPSAAHEAGGARLFGYRLIGRDRCRYSVSATGIDEVNLKNSTVESLADRSWDDIGEIITKAIGDSYAALLEQHGRALWQADRFHIAFVHAVCNLAVSMKLDGDDVSRAQQTEFYRRLREMTVDNMVVLTVLRSGKRPQECVEPVCNVVDEFMRDPSAPNPFSRDVTAIKHLIDGLQLLFDEADGGIEEIVAGASRAYEALGGKREAALIDTDSAARDFVAAFMVGAKDIEIDDAGTNDGPLLQVALNALALVTAAHLIKEQVAVGDSDDAWTCFVQVWSDAALDYLGSVELDQADRLMEIAEGLNLGECRNMLISMLMEQQRMGDIVAAISVQNDRWTKESWRKRLYSAIEATSSWYWDQLARARKSGH